MASSLPAADGPGASGRRSWRPAAIVAAALAALLVVAALSGNRVLVADPDASAVTDADIRLGQELFGGVSPPASLVEGCFADDGTIEPACLGDGRPETGAQEIDVEIVPRRCREDRSISADCIESQLDVDVPDACTRGDDRVDVGCLAEAGTLLVLTDRCVDDGRVRQECLTIGLYGVPDQEAEERTYDDLPYAVPGDVDDEPAPDRVPTSAPDRRDTDTEDESDDGGSNPLAGALDLVGAVFGILLLVGLLGLLVFLVLRGMRGWRPTRAVVPDVDGDEDDHDRAVMAASIDAGARQLDLSGDPRQAIIAAYAMLLEGLAACAQARHPAETPLEHLERVLAALDVHPDPLRELTTLFGEARFSDHAMTDVQRDRARDALAAAAADLERVRETVG